MTQPTNTHHLRIMVDDGLLVRDQHGRQVWHSIASSRKCAILDLLRKHGSKFPRTIGRPLDTETARARAQQISTLTDPVNLRVLSVIAATPEPAGSPGLLADI